jgi:hypothetical protein
MGVGCNVTTRTLQARKDPIPIVWGSGWVLGPFWRVRKILPNRGSNPEPFSQYRTAIPATLSRRTGYRVICIWRIGKETESNVAGVIKGPRKISARSDNLSFLCGCMSVYFYRHWLVYLVWEIGQS